MAGPAVVYVSAEGRLPLIAVRGGAPRRCVPRKGPCTFHVALMFAAAADGVFQPEHQTIEIHGQDFGRNDGGASVAVGEPPRTKIPAALRARPNVPIELLRRTAAGACEFCVFPERLIARR